VAPGWKPLLTTSAIFFQIIMENETKRIIVYGAGEGYPSTGAVVGSQVGPAASSAHDHGHSGVDRQAPGSVSAPGEAKED
jgi:hypothetical protein